MTRTQDDKLQGWDKVLRAAIAWTAFWGILDAIIVAFTVRPWEHIPHRHYSVGWYQMVGVMLGLALLGWWVSSIAVSYVSYHADRAFLARLFMSSGVNRRRAERLADIKIRHGG